MGGGVTHDGGVQLVGGSSGVTVQLELIVRVQEVVKLAVLHPVDQARPTHRVPSHTVGQARP